MNIDKLHDEFMNAGFIELEDKELINVEGGDWNSWLNVISIIGYAFNTATGN
ncbi:hypothetical protein ABUK63_03505 [Lactococcus lactis]|uniref:hypothetical protein n=1 Tax=Lactococcus lactis TaxID=1358 RepID=UPI002026BFD9|nr:hypothetical protein [Lactococcus lactis]MCL9638859.1 hypothetical protein [Lactococcus lactis]